MNEKCIVINWHMTITLVVLRSVNDFIYLLHILPQFRLAYVDPESKLVESGDLVDDPKMIARNYLSGKFIVDFFLILPLPQIPFQHLVQIFQEISFDQQFLFSLFQGCTDVYL